MGSSSQAATVRHCRRSRRRAQYTPFTDERDHRLMAFRLLVRDFTQGVEQGTLAGAQLHRRIALSGGARRGARVVGNGAHRKPVGCRPASLRSNTAAVKNEHGDCSSSPASSARRRGGGRRGRDARHARAGAGGGWLPRHRVLPLDARSAPVLCAFAMDRRSGVRASTQSFRTRCASSSASSH